MAHNYVERKLPCPDEDCGSSDAYYIIQDSDGQHGYCFSCERRFNLNGKNQTMSNPKELIPTEEWPQEYYRSISKKTLDKFGAKYSKHYFDYNDDEVKIGTQAGLVYHYLDEGGTRSQKVRRKDSRTGKKTFTAYNRQPTTRLYGHQLFSPGGKKITITEGENDCMAVYEMMGDWPVVSLIDGAGSAKNITEKDHEFLSSFQEIIVCFDNDKQGRKAVEEFCAIYPSKVKVVEFPQQYKDAHQFLEEGAKEKFRHCWFNAAKWNPSNIVFPMDIMDAVINPPKYEVVPYPWEGLNAQIFGLHTPEVITILAAPKAGKSLLTAAIIEHLHRSTDSIIGDITVENTPDERSRTLLSLRTKKPLHLALVGEDLDISKDQLEQAYKDFYEDRRIILFEKDGITDSMEIINKVNYLVEVLGAKYIVFDHINYLTSYHGDDERKTLDKLSNMLVDIAKDKRICMIIVSHVNDDGKQFGSRNLIKASYTVLQMHRDKNNPDEFLRNLTELTVSESRRYGSRTGKPIYLKYSEDNYSLTEIDAETVEEYKKLTNLKEEGLNEI
jgi:twinkle protein